MRVLRKVVAGCLAAGTVLAVMGCGGSHSRSTARTTTAPDMGNRTVDIYSSLPLQGTFAGEGEAIVKGIELALAEAHGRAGSWTVNYRSLNDATAAPNNTWDPDETAANARQAAEDPRAVYYVGEFGSLASEVSIVILNQAKVPQVSPANTYVGLTTNLPGSSTGEPTRYYPSAVRTYLRLVPIDSVQAAADLIAMKEAGCKKVALGRAGSYGTSMAALLELEKAQYGVTIVSDTPIDEAASNSGPYVASIRRQRPDCFFLAGTADRTAVRVTEEVNAVLPRARLFAPDEMCTRAWTNPRMGGVPATVDRLIECTLPPLSVGSYPGGRQFLAAYHARYGGAAPDPYAIYGYEAMKLGLDTISRLGAQGNNKLAVLRALFAVRRRHSVLGAYGFDRNGDTTLKAYGLYRVGASGDPVFYKTITAPAAHS
jgi:branched-chain amino acid transport system substrate-binding protein